MFELEQAITEWRKQMLTAGIKTPVPLDELESHLRDAVEQLLKPGSDAQRAFEAAVQQIGTPHVLKTEFRKMGLLDSRRLAGFRPYMIVINLILAAILTTPEVWSQVVMFIPLQLLYEASIWIARYSETTAAMFNLEQSIAEWRRQMAAGGIKSPELLDELESHLRDDVARQVRLGSGGQQAFELAVRRLGQTKILHAEFAKARAARGVMQRLMGFVCAVMVGFILLMSGFTFFFIEFGFGEQIVAYAAVIVSLWVACRWRYVVRFLPVLPDRRKRTALAFAFIISGFVCSSFFAQVILPHFERGRDGQIPAIGFWLLFPIAVGFGLAGGIQEAARRLAATADS